MLWQVGHLPYMQMVRSQKTYMLPGTPPGMKAEPGIKPWATPRCPEFNTCKRKESVLFGIKPNLLVPPLWNSIFFPYFSLNHHYHWSFCTSCLFVSFFHLGYAQKRKYLAFHPLGVSGSHLYNHTHLVVHSLHRCTVFTDWMNTWLNNHYAIIEYGQIFISNASTC